MKHIVLFDIDGTLLRAQGAGEIAFQRAFEDVFNTESSWSKLTLHGRTDPDIIDEICETINGRVQTIAEDSYLKERFIFHFEQIIFAHEPFTLMPGVELLLQSLHAQEDVLLGIETGNLQPTAEMKLMRGAIHSYFQSGGYASDARDRKDIVRIANERMKALLRSSESVTVTFIGDSINDILAADANSARSIGVATGGVSLKTYHTHCKPTLFAEDLSETEKLISFILGR
ncbi:MAG: HAD family hydrolase [Bdellovibrionota bacterium]